MWPASASRDGARRAGWLLAGLLVTVLAPPGRAGDRIRLRNLNLITKKVERFDEDGIKLEGTAALLTWDQVEAGSVDADQKRFDDLLKKLGDPLFRIRKRMQDGSYKDLLEDAAKVFPLFESRRSPTAYMVCQGLMWARLEAGQREAAVEPYLACLDVLHATKDRPIVPGDRKLSYDTQTALSAELPPVWFDAKAAKAALPGVVKRAAALDKNVSPGANVYCATLALAAGADAEPYLKTIADSTNPTVAEMATVLRAQKEVLSGKLGESFAALRKRADDVKEANRPFGYYWLGVGLIGSRDAKQRKEGVLRLLSLPALYGERSPDLAAAGLYLSAKTLEALPDANDYKAGVSRIRLQLLVRFGQTYHGLKLKAEQEPKSPKGEK